MKKDISGHKSGCLTAIKESTYFSLDTKGKKLLYWDCFCEACGKTVPILKGRIASNLVKSCGCKRQTIKDKNQKHSMSKTVEYQTWSSMMKRCYRNNNKSFRNYGGRGIKVCKRWHDFINFYTDMGKRPDGHSLERIDNNGNYEPSNCCWTTRIKQARNKRTIKTITLNGETKSIPEWAEKLGLSAERINQRITRDNWDPIKALTTPIDNNYRIRFGYELNGETKTLSEWGEQYGISAGTVYRRIVDGKLSLLEALTTPTDRKRGKLITYNNETLNQKEWANKIGIDDDTLRLKLLSGMTIEQILAKPKFSNQRFITYGDKTLNLTEWSKVTGIKSDTIAYRLKNNWSIGRALGYE